MLSAIWAYITLGVSTAFTQELGALVGGFAAEQQHLELSLVLVTCASAVFVESVALYSLGRWNAAWVRLRLRKASPVARRLLRSMRYSPWRATIISRFAFGARIPLPLACGAARVPPWIFLTGTAISSAVWSCVFVGLGWVFGEGAVLVVGEARRYEWVVGAVLVLAVAVVFWWLKKRERAARKNDPTAGTPPPLS
ncbi:MAG: VTT domain-containing protein [Cytophagaceae bacterium]|nr:VTT domain-containing protein [Gemmatimonadaceae bacterium]